MALVRERTISIEQLPLVSEVSASFLRIEEVAWSGQRIPIFIQLRKVFYHKEISNKTLVPAKAQSAAS
jgi:orotate phosphoribosyltransferase